jgi:hypothetical protein
MAIEAKAFDNLTVNTLIGSNLTGGSAQEGR